MDDADTVETDRTAVETLRNFAQVSLQNNQTNLVADDKEALEDAVSVVDDELQMGDSE